MRASEILRGLADLIAAAEQGSGENQMGQTPETPNHAELTAVKVDHEDQTDKGGVFVPPLQAKIELLKKSVNVDNVYDQGGPEEELTGHGDDNDELGQIKQLSGIKNVVATAEAADDEPLDV